ncbi:MAG: arsenate reductase ArsC [Dehalococcoidia bacterium]
MKRVLFVCTGNRARSQMAEGLLRHLAGDRFQACSAGTEPKSIARLTGEVMREIGVDVSGQRSKSVAEFAGERFDYVITVCDSARERCPAFPDGGERIHWSVGASVEAEAREKPSRAASPAVDLPFGRAMEGFLRQEVVESGAPSG